MMMMMNQFPLVSLFSMAIQKVYCIPGILHFQTYPCCFTLAPTLRDHPRHQASSPRHSSWMFQPRLMTSYRGFLRRFSLLAPNSMFMTGWDIVEHGGTYHSDPEYPRILRLKKNSPLSESRSGSHPHNPTPSISSGKSWRWPSDSSEMAGLRAATGDQFWALIRVSWQRVMMKGTPEMVLRG